MDAARPALPLGTFAGMFLTSIGVVPFINIYIMSPFVIPGSSCATPSTDLSLILSSR